MNRLPLWIAILLIAAGGGHFVLTKTHTLVDLALIALIGGCAGYILRIIRDAVAAKADEYHKQLKPLPRPDYEPRLFGVPMEWDPESGFWCASFGGIDVDLHEREPPGSWGFTWHIESLSATGIESLDEAVDDLERELTRIRNAIPIAKSWHMENA